MGRALAAEKSMREKGASSDLRSGSRVASSGHGSRAGIPMFLQGSVGGARGPTIGVQRKCADCGPDQPCPQCAGEDGTHGVRTKLTVSQPADPEEQEADRVADQVMRLPVGTASIAPRTTAPASFAIPPIGSGRPLSPGARQFFEPRFGRDLSDVRIHDDSAAADSARNVHARAYAYGDQVVFGAGQYAPDHDAGRRLLAHELTHVLQQRGSR